MIPPEPKVDEPPAYPIDTRPIDTPDTYDPRTVNRGE
jgi:hypothetical protein